MQLEDDIPPVQVMRSGYNSIVGVYNKCLLLSTCDKIIYPISLDHPLIVTHMLIMSNEIERAITWANHLSEEQQNVIGRILVRRGNSVDALNLELLSRTIRVKILVDLNKPKELFDLFDKEQDIKCWRDDTNTVKYI